MTTQIKGNATSTFGGNIDVTGNVITDAPAFSAYMGASQSVSAATFTKVAFNTENFDTNSNYDTTLYRFTPTVEGYYQVNIVLYVDLAGRGIIRLYKNGVYAHAIHDVDTNDTRAISGSALMYMNGTTDYLEVYGWRTLAGDILGTDIRNNHFEAFLARAV